LIVVVFKNLVEAIAPAAGNLRQTLGNNNVSRADNQSIKGFNALSFCANSKSKCNSWASD
jgi:hypothetical protein